MNLYDRVLAELSEIETTEFWKRYREYLAKYREDKVKDLITFPKDKIEHLQGEIVSIDRVARIPRDILSNLRAEVESKGG